MGVEEEEEEEEDMAGSVCLWRFFWGGVGVRVFYRPQMVFLSGCALCFHPLPPLLSVCVSVCLS